MNTPNQFAATFLHEAADQLALIEEIILEIEKNPRDTEAINRLFRVFHTIKGSGSMFGFDRVANFTHHVETLLDNVRSGLVTVTTELVDAILASKDYITTLLKGDESAASDVTEARIIAQLDSLIPRADETAPEPAQATVASCQQESPLPAVTFHISFCPEPGILTRGVDPAGLLADLRSLGCCEIKAKTETVAPLEQFSADICGFSWDITLTTDKGLNAIKDVFIFVEDDSKISIQPVATPVSLTKPAEKSSNKPVDKAPAKLPEKPVAPQPGKTSETRKAQGTDGSVRVPSERLDRLVNLVGELVINQSRLSQISCRLDEPSLAASTEDLERLVGELRDIVLGIRMMPIGTTFNRFKRLVRDLSAELGKEIDLVTQGEETELDKTVIDQLGDPLVHLIRNAVDHGIATPEKRLSEGKPRRGTIHLTAHYEGANVIIKIEDDGRGLDQQAIRAKAIERNLIPADKNLSESELFNLILLPGFSTASTVTSVSGRGVGMDVVKRQIDALRGTLEISSQPGHGTCMALTLPLTLAIIDGLLVEVKQEQYIVPMSSVRENVELTSAQRATANGRNLLAVRGQLVPYLRLRDMFDITGEEQDLERVVIVSVGGNRIGLVVDRVIGSRQTVIQSLGRFYQNITTFSGATIMGDGRVALILDVPGLIHFQQQTAITCNT